VPAEWVIAAGVPAGRVLLYLHGGVYQIGSAAARSQAAMRSNAREASRRVRSEYARPSLAAKPDPGWMCWSCRTVNSPAQPSCQKKRCYRAAPEPADIATRLLEGEPAPQSVHRMVVTADHSGD
jgi:hypothetical protein